MKVTYTIVKNDPEIRTYIAQAQNRRSVGDNGNGIPASGKLIALVHILLDFKAGLSHTGGVGKSQSLVAVGSDSGANFKLSSNFVVKLQRFFSVSHGFTGLRP